MDKGKDNKPHIGIFGRRNVGKSSFINTLTGQDVAIVSDIPGTTTDPVRKSIEIFGIGPAIIIDTAGIDDSGELGEKRISKTLEAVKHIDCAILMLTDNVFGSFEENLIKRFSDYEVPFMVVHNKSDVEKADKELIKKKVLVSDIRIVDFSCRMRENLELLIDELKKTIPETAYQKPSLLGGLIKQNDIVLLITPIDSEAPDGRMILPQMMAVRDVLDNNCIAIVLRETELEHFFKTTTIKPVLAITDSQAFGKVMKIIPEDIPLTGFSIVFARMRGPFDEYLKGTPKIKDLKDGDRILILESCTHQVSCEDIGRFKIPRWLKEYTGKNLEFDVVSGLTHLPKDIKEYAMVIQCGGCMITRKQVVSRLKRAIEAGIPVTNYGLVIAYVNNIFDRVTKPFISV
jgi:[FeFe] hydrogenase H-cluster maturation GTPase HydF